MFTSLTFSSIVFSQIILSCIFSVSCGYIIESKYFRIYFHCKYLTVKQIFAFFFQEKCPESWFGEAFYF